MSDHEPCERFRPLLTGYLDGDLEGDAGADVRGHLRECAACRQVADDEAALRDGLRALPSLDPPAVMWNDIRARLAQAEVESSHRPAWRRALARWAPQARAAAPYAGALAAAALAIIVWQVRHGGSPELAQLPTAPEHHVAAPIGPTQVTPPVTPSDADVTADLAHDGARRDARYQTETAELEKQLADATASWPDARKKELDARVAELHAAITAARDGRPRQKAWRALERYLENALTRDEVALADNAGPGGAP